MTTAEIKALSDSTFFDNTQGGITPENHRAFNNELTDFIIKLSATFVVDSDDAFAAWANNTAGNDYTSVLIKPGTWTSTVEVNLTNAGTKTIFGMPGSKLMFTSRYGLVYDTIPNSAEYWMYGINVESNNTENNENIAFSNCTNLTNCTGIGTGSDGSSIGFDNCANLVNCTGTGSGTGSDGTSMGFSNCTNLTNCTGIGTGSDGSSIGFDNCANLVNCTGTGIYTNSDSTSMGFSNCTNLTNCIGTGTGIGIGIGTNFGYGFYLCRIMTFCSPSAIASRTSAYYNCFMHAANTNDPVADTAAGGWNRR